MIGHFSLARMAELMRPHLNEEMLSDAQARDIGICLTEVRALARARPGVYDQMMKMAERFGLSPADIKRDHWRAVDVARSCTHCRLAKDCKRFLDGQATSFKATRCPNADIYTELAVELDKVA